MQIFFPYFSSLAAIKKCTIVPSTSSPIDDGDPFVDKIAFYLAKKIRTLAYVQFLLYLRPPPPSMMGTPSKVRSRSAGHTQRQVFFAKPCGSPILLRYISSYTSIAAIYLCKIDKISFYFEKTPESLHMCSFCCTFAVANE